MRFLGNRPAGFQAWFLERNPAPLRNRAGIGRWHGAMSTRSPGPVARQSRINAIDAPRGPALLGILSVNMEFFAEPFGQMMQLAAPEGVGNMIVFSFATILCEGKFYPLPSMPFGMGAVLRRRGDEDAPNDRNPTEPGENAPARTRVDRGVVKGGRRRCTQRAHRTGAACREFRPLVHPGFFSGRNGLSTHNALS